MQAFFAIASRRRYPWIVLLLGCSVLAMLTLWIASLVRSRKQHLLPVWRLNGCGGFSGAGTAAAWADINEDPKPEVSDAGDRD